MAAMFSVEVPFFSIPMLSFLGLESSAFSQLKYISGTISNTWYFLFSFNGGVTRGSSLSPDLQTLMLCTFGCFLLHL